MIFSFRKLINYSQDKYSKLVLDEVKYSYFLNNKQKTKLIYMLSFQENGLNWLTSKAFFG